MGEGLYRSPDGRTAYAEPYDHLDPEDAPLWRDAWDDLVAAIRDCLGASWHPVARDWRGRGERIIARNGLHEIWLVEDSYARIHVTFGIRRDLDGTDALARSLIPERAETFFDRLQATYELRADESPRRARRSPLTFSGRNSKAGRHWLEWLPIHHWSKARVFDEIEAAGERPHWIYTEGMSRCSCSFCIMATRKDLQRAAQLRPRLAAEYIALEEEIGHTLSPTRVPLREILGNRPLPPQTTHPS